MTFIVLLKNNSLFNDKKIKTNSLRCSHLGITIDITYKIPFQDSRK